MTVDELRQTGRIIFEAVVGSQAYGTALPTSDLDIRGIYMPTLKELLTVVWPKNVEHRDEVEDEAQDIKFFRLDKFIALARDNNPNIIELLYLPPDVVRTCSEPMQRLIANRHLFLSKKAKHSFAGYAHAQIERAKGQNKWVNQGAKYQRGIQKLRLLLRSGDVSREWIETRLGKDVLMAVGVST